MPRHAILGATRSTVTIFPDGVPPRAAGDGWSNPYKANAMPNHAMLAPTITGSAAHPGRKSNNTICYTRVIPQNAARIFGAFEESE